MAEAPIYDTIGNGYAAGRRPDHRVAAQIHDAIGPARTILNVGAGTGNYEPDDRPVVAVEPSAEMLAQRPPGPPAVQAVAEALPIASDAFDCAMGTFTVHHWSDRNQGLRELARVSRRQVLLVYDPEVSTTFWLADYYPALATAPWEIDAPRPEHIAEVLTVREVRTLEVPADCTDGFSGAYWCRPEEYLRPEVQRSMSTLRRLEPDELHAGTEALREAISSGAWDEAHGHLRGRSTFDMGYRLVISESDPTTRGV